MVCTHGHGDAGEKELHGAAPLLPLLLRLRLSRRGASEGGGRVGGGAPRLRAAILLQLSQVCKVLILIPSAGSVLFRTISFSFSTTGNKINTIQLLSNNLRRLKVTFTIHLSKHLNLQIIIIKASGEFGPDEGRLDIVEKSRDTQREYKVSIAVCKSLIVNCPLIRSFVCLSVFKCSRPGPGGHNMTSPTYLLAPWLAPVIVCLVVVAAHGVRPGLGPRWQSDVGTW